MSTHIYIHSTMYRSMKIYDVSAAAAATGDAAPAARAGAAAAATLVIDQ